MKVNIENELKLKDKDHCEKNNEMILVTNI